MRPMSVFKHTLALLSLTLPLLLLSLSPSTPKTVSPQFPSQALDLRKKDAKGNGSDSSIPYPPGFTPKQSMFNEVEQVKQSALNHSPSKSLGCSSRILENSQKADDHLIPVNLGKGHTHKEGGSILEVLEGMIKVGQTMGFSMEGVHKDMEKIIDMEVKYLWGNTNFDFIFSEALGFSGGILCVWDHNMFRKEQHIISDNFVALYGTWISNKLSDIDKKLDQGGANDDILLARTECMNFLFESKAVETRDIMQKAKIKWAVEGDENSKFFHGMVNRKRTNLAVKDLELPITRDEIRNAVWSCGENKSPGPDGFSFEFFRKFWHVVGSDFCTAVEWFFDHASFPIGCNSSFITLIPKSLEPKVVGDFRPISLIGSIYKVITKILQSRLSSVISDLISDVQTTFLPNRQILDGPFIINELLARCHHKKQQAMIRGCLNSSMASILVNGSPTTEFHFHRGLKQGDPLAPYLFILVMESLHLSFSRVIDAGIFTGVRIDPSIMISHLFYADDAVFIGVWSQENLKGGTSLLARAPLRDV
nr:RNA-directed DNA polymerase, eukaryota [Tanacetum cinerariifolium]